MLTQLAFWDFRPPDERLLDYLQQAPIEEHTRVLRGLVIASQRKLFGGGRARCRCGRRGQFAVMGALGDGGVTFVCNHCGRMQQWSLSEVAEARPC